MTVSLVILEGNAATADRIYVADSSNSRVQIFDLEGNFVDKFGSRGSGPNMFNGAHHLTLSDNKIYVADRFNDRVQVL